LKWGVKTEDKTPDPVKVIKRYIDGIKPGTTVLISDQTAWVVYPKGGKKTPVAVFGVPVK
jgi:hypothetical protein